MDPEPSDCELLRALEECLLQPSGRKDAVELDALLAEDVEIASSGRVFSRAKIIDMLRDELEAQRWLTDFEVKDPAPAVVLATYRAARRSSTDGPTIYSLRSSIWKLVDGRWRMVFNQGTLTDMP